MQIFTVNTLKKHYNILSVNLEYDYASIFSLIQLKLRNEYEPRWFKISDFIFCNEIIIDGSLYGVSNNKDEPSYICKSCLVKDIDGYQ